MQRRPVGLRARILVEPVPEGIAPAVGDRIGHLVTNALLARVDEAALGQLGELPVDLAPIEVPEVAVMTVTCHNIPGFDPPPMSSHATAARGDVIIHISGQVGTDDTGAVAEGLAAQTECAILNVATALEAAGASVR